MKILSSRSRRTGMAAAIALTSGILVLATTPNAARAAADLIFFGQGWSGPGLNIRTKISNRDGTWSSRDQVLGDGSGVHRYPTLQGDFDGDGNTDLAFIGPNWSGTGLNTRTKFANGDGTWRARSAVLGDGSAVYKYPAMVGDMNADGRSDIVFLVRTSTGVQFRTKFSNGDGTWMAKMQFMGDGSAIHRYPALVGDVNADGRSDIVFLVRTSTGVQFRTKFANGDGTWTAKTYSTGDGSAIHRYPPVMGDVDGDGDADIVFVGHWNDESGNALKVRVKFSNGDGTWTSREHTFPQYGREVHSHPVLMGDVNGDRLMDLVFVGQYFDRPGLSVLTLLSQGRSGFNDSLASLGDGEGVQRHRPRLGDVDADGLDDLVFVGQNWSGTGLNIRTKFSRGDGTWRSAFQVLGDGAGVHEYPSILGDVTDKLALAAPLASSSAPEPQFCVYPGDSSKRSISGRVTYKGTIRRAIGVQIRSYDRDPNSGNDLMGTSDTDYCGNYLIKYAARHWDDSFPIFDTRWRPDIYSTVYVPARAGTMSRAARSRELSNYPHRMPARLNMSVSLHRWDEHYTDFDPVVHGWPFENDSRKVCLKATCQDENWFLDSITSFLEPEWALCGGMSLSAKRRFERGTSVEPFSARVKEELVRNQLDATLGTGAIFKFLDFQARPDRPHRIALHTIGNGTMKEWRELREILALGRTRVLGLVREGPTEDPGKLSGNHQVLAIGYRENRLTNEVELFVYDPNYPASDARFESVEGLRDDVSTIRFNTQLRDSQINADQITPWRDSYFPTLDKLRGFFIND